MTQDLPWRLAAILLSPVLGAIAAEITVRLPATAGERVRSSGRRTIAMATACLAVGAWAAWALEGPTAPVGAALGAALLLIAVVDAEHLWLPNLFTYPLGLAGLALAPLVGIGRMTDHMIGAAAGFLVLAGLAAAYRRVRGRDGLGGGDARLLAALGAWVGWAGLPTVLVWASAAGLSWVLARRLSGRAMRRDDPLPFGVCLAVGGWLTWLYGPLGRAGW